MAKSKCKHCGERKETSEGVKTNIGFFCSVDHAYMFGIENKEKGRKKLVAKRKKEKQAKAKVEREKTAQRKKELKKRSWWLDTLQKLVNQYVTKVLYPSELCYTCERAKADSVFNAGHCFSRGSRAELRFNLNNIRKQCVTCNLYESGRHKEFCDKLKVEIGEVEFLKLSDESQSKSLKEQFPHWSDIEKEILRYRKLLRDNGVKPIV